MFFRDVRHQDRALSILRRALRSGRTHHAYLFDGPEGVGKRLAARALAARLLCLDTTQQPDADACGTCHACHMFAADTHPDFHFIHRGLHKQHPDPLVRRSKGLFLAVDVIRHFMIEQAGSKATQGRGRVFVMDEAERMNDAASNALLKTLEEPPGETTLILVTPAANELLPTIRSRCQRIPFDLLPTDYVAQQLVQKCRTSADDARTLALLASGRLGVAALWQRIGLLDALDQVGDLLVSLENSDPEAFGKGLVALANELAKRTSSSAPDDADASDDDDSGGGKAVSTDALRAALRLVFMLVASFYREAALARYGAASLRNARLPAPVLERLAALRPDGRLDAGPAAVLTAERMLERNVAPQLVGERLAAALLGDVPAAL